MSHAAGEVIIDGKTVRWYEYNGTGDIAISCLYLTPEKLQFHWKHYHWKKCLCGKPSTECFLYSSYGSGFYWPSRVCLNCEAITENRDPYELDEWPKSGRPLDT